MNKKIASGTMLTMLLAGLLLTTFEIGEISASPDVCIYVDMPPQGYITGVPTGQILKVAVYIESPPEWENTPDGIVGWVFSVRVDPEVLEPIKVKSATNGYFLYDFADSHWYTTAILYVRDPEEGLFFDVAEFIMGYGTLGVGAGGDGKLCELWFRSKSQTAYTSIDIYHGSDGDIGKPIYCTADGLWHRCNIGEDGHYNALPTSIDIEPQTLNLRSEGQWITAYIELTEDHNISNIDLSTVMLNDTIPISLLEVPAPEPAPTEIGDYDEDGIPDLMVKFDRAMVSEFILSEVITNDHVTLTMTGEVNGTPFRGEDTIELVLGAGGSKKRK